MQSGLATSVCRLRHDPVEQGPTEPHAGRSTFLLSSGGAGGRYYSVAFDTGPFPPENQIPCQTLVACLMQSCSACPTPVPTGLPSPLQPHNSIVSSSCKFSPNRFARSNSTDGGGTIRWWL